MKVGVRALAVSALALASVIACGARQLTPKEQAQLQALRSELQGINTALGEAQHRDEQLTGGLVKTLVAVRLEVLSTSKALIQQRIDAIESGAKITMEIHGTKPDDQAAARLAQEIAATENECRAAKAEAERYGGLIGAIKASTVATEEETLAMLRQRYIMAKYGITWPSTLTPDASSSVASKNPQNPRPSAPEPPILVAAEGPFGFQAGLAKTQVEQMIGTNLTPVAGATLLFSTAKIPRPHPSFESYSLLITPEAGLCQIRAVGIDLTSSSHGLDLRDAFDKMYTSLSGIYGTGHKVDQLLPGSIWNAPQDWMMGLLKKERILQADWSRESGSTMRNNLDSVILVAKASGGDRGYLLLQYTFTNNSQCQEEITRGQKESL